MQFKFEKWYQLCTNIIYLPFLVLRHTAIKIYLLTISPKEVMLLYKAYSFSKRNRSKESNISITDSWKPKEVMGKVKNLRGKKKKKTSHPSPYRNTPHTPPHTKQTNETKWNKKKTNKQTNKRTNKQKKKQRTNHKQIKTRKKNNKRTQKQRLLI